MGAKPFPLLNLLKHKVPIYYPWDPKFCPELASKQLYWLEANLKEFNLGEHLEKLSKDLPVFV